MTMKSIIVFVAVLAVSPAGLDASLMDACMEGGIVALSSADVVTDFIVTKQYWDNAKKTNETPTFFLISAGLLGLSSFCFTIIYVLLSFDEDDFLWGFSRKLRDYVEKWSDCSKFAIFCLFVILLVIVLTPVGFLFPLVLYYRTKTDQITQAAFKLPFRSMIQVSQSAFSLDSELKVHIDEAQAATTGIKDSLCDVLMITHAGLEDSEGSLSNFIGTWLEVARNTAPLLGAKGMLKHDLSFEGDGDEGGEALRSLLIFSDAIDEDTPAIRQKAIWNPQEKAWIVNSQNRSQLALPFRARIRMLDYNVLECYVPVRVDTTVTRIVLSYMIREGTFFEPRRNHAKTLELFREWIANADADDPQVQKFIVWVGDTKFPIPPTAVSAGEQGVEELRERQMKATVYYHTEYLPFVAEYVQYQSAKHWDKVLTQAPFLYETCCETIGQSLLQTTAITIYSQRSPEEISWTQFMSIGIALGSLMSKAHVFCESMVGEVFYWKMACICFDISCLFYTFSALWSAQRGDEGTFHVFFITRPLDLFSTIYVWTVFAQVVAIFLLFIVTMSAGLYTGCRDGKTNTGDILGCICLMIIGPVMAIAPCICIVQILKMTLVVLIIKTHEAWMAPNGAFYTKAYSFAAEAINSKVFDARIKAINHVVSGAETPLQELDSPLSKLRTFFNSLDTAEIYTELVEDLVEDPEVSPAAWTRATCCAGCKICCAATFGGILCLCILMSTLYCIFFPVISFSIACWHLYVSGIPINIFRASLFCANMVFLLVVIILSVRSRRFLKFAILVYTDENKIENADAQMIKIQRVYNEVYKDANLDKSDTSTDLAVVEADDANLDKSDTSTETAVIEADD